MIHCQDWISGNSASLLFPNAKTEESHKNAIQYGERIVFIKSMEATIYDQNLYAHVILDPNKKAKDTQLLLRDAFTDGTDAKEVDNNMLFCGYFVLISRELVH